MNHDEMIEKWKRGELTEDISDEIDLDTAAKVWRDVGKQLGIQPKKRKTPEEVAAERAKREAES